MNALVKWFMLFARSTIVAFSTFSRIPVPQLEWDPDDMRLLMGAFPLVGLVMGFAVGAWLLICDAAQLGVLLAAAGVTVLPVALSGGIHLDGLCDVCDALASNSSAGRRREILKDPHVGAFAAIGVSVYLMVFCAISSEIVFCMRDGAMGRFGLCGPLSSFAVVGLVFVYSRVLAGVATTCFPRSASEGMLAAFQMSAEKRSVVVLLLVWWVLCAILLIAVQPVCGCAVLVAGGLCLAWMRGFANRALGGMSGDLAGFFLQICELVLLAVIVACFKVVQFL